MAERRIFVLPEGRAAPETVNATGLDGAPLTAMRAGRL